jgi:glycosyltransferase involved in cell wall biosynthesis
MPRTVAYLTPLYFDETSCLGGGERYPLNLAKGVFLASNGRYRVELISFGDRTHRQELAPGVELCVLPVAHKPANPLDVVSWELPRALESASLVHIHQAYTRCAEVGLLIARQQRKPICVTDHGGPTSTLGLEVGSLELADRIVAYSDFGASLYRCRTPIVVIKGGVDAELFSPPAERPPRDRMLYVGRLLAHKGIDRLIAALPQDIPLTICGRPYDAEYFARLAQLAVGKNVTFVTDADDAQIRDLYARAWANVLPSVYRDCFGRVHQAPELMGFTLLEAMACGTPGICSRVAAMPEFVRHGESGFVYDNLDELREQMTTLANDSSLADRMGQRARTIVAKEYDLRVAGGKLAAVYDELIDAAVRREVAA